MKCLTEHLWFEVPGRGGFINITQKVEELLRQIDVHASPKFVQTNLT